MIVRPVYAPPLPTVIGPGISLPANSGQEDSGRTETRFPGWLVNSKGGLGPSAILPPHRESLAKNEAHKEASRAKKERHRFRKCHLNI